MGVGTAVAVGGTDVAVGSGVGSTVSVGCGGVAVGVSAAACVGGSTVGGIDEAG